MIVTNDTRRPERAEVASDPVPYAYAPTSVTSFVTVLSEIAKQEASRAKTPQETESATQVSDTPANEAPEPADEASSEDGNTAKPEVAAESKEPTPDAEGMTTGDTAPSAEHDPDTVSEETLEAQPTPAEELPGAADESDTAIPESSPLPQGMAATTNGDESEAPAATNTGMQQNLAATGSTAESHTPPAAEEGEMPEDADADAATPTPTFPKTLNALLAENAVRHREPDSAAMNTQTPGPEIAQDLAQEPAIEETPPSAAPAPRGAAMEVGGVRTEAPVVPRVPLANLPGELTQQIHFMQQEGNRTMRIRLVPENLGELKIEIQGTGDTMRVRMIAATPAARDALESQMGDLRQALQKQGLSLDQFSVDSGQEKHEPQQRYEQPRRRTAHNNSPLNVVEFSEPLPTIPASVATPSSALNIFA